METIFTSPEAIKVLGVGGIIVICVLLFFKHLIADNHNRYMNSSDHYAVTNKVVNIVALIAFMGMALIAITFFKCNESKPAPAAKPTAAPTKAGSPKAAPPSRQSFEPEMVSVQGGTFQMGSNDSDASDDEKPVHSVTVSNFSIGKYEVTQAQWRAVMGNNPSQFKNCDNCPVEQVSWDDIQQFLSKLNSMSSKRYRLPTEAEWEYAARGGSNSGSYKYSGSNEVNAVAWYIGNSSNTHSVGTKQANELNIYDMSGNAWEWCSDWYGEKYYSSPANNPTGTLRVLRGGGYFLPPSSCRVTDRASGHPTNRYLNYGFRVVSFP